MNEEFYIQVAVVRWVYYNYPDALFTCSPAAAKSARRGHDNRLMGYRRGWPDLFFAEPRGPYHGLAVEIKTKTGKLDSAGYQERCLMELNQRNYMAIVCHSFEEATEQIKSYLVLDK